MNEVTLTTADLKPEAQTKAPEQVDLFDFNAQAHSQFYHADVITFTAPDGKAYLLKDRYGMFPADLRPAKKLSMSSLEPA